ncbi:MAG: nitroreductase family deazaflavin-dependent oxidoreductase [Anaerolineaceae bacterium]
MNKSLLRFFMGINTFLIHASKGNIGGKLGKQTILLMHTVGRKSGKTHVIPIAYFTAGKNYYVIGSNWGQEKNAAWYHNLKGQPETTIELGGRELAVHAREAEGEEYDKLWANAISHHPDYNHYKEMTQRHIPIIVFEPK